ncbi:polysaccharide deacetylase family protein [Acidithiobacillus ferrivorans]|uniref:polysaccharide deacetylase family protein n=1 Tax=Acidithiobacillus ferrivorans TaxID=160808 RepID=UPI001C07A095|nr:polysaccharide deacetylase family protein [Acidithiobacillus ferrivorans]MBU2765345.1 polysaccharide deacetylase family protein [Acidithiobacillus ferrivorans]MBU2851141.1 polysaccharide deacetylase family protein [Acidithiobacillus ferrivorans]
MELEKSGLFLQAGRAQRTKKPGMRIVWQMVSLLALFFAVPAWGSGTERGVPILLYHRFGPVLRDAMTVRTEVFEAQIEYLKRHGYQIVPLREVVAYIRGVGPPPPPHSVAITVDDGHQSVYTDMFPLVQRYHIPVTLFIYPSAISRASYALTWDELRIMHDSGLVDIQSHTYWHPNFKIDKKRLAPQAYEKFVAMQLEKSRAKLDQELGIKVDMLAWPYGIHDADLIRSAVAAGYVAAFTMVRAPAGPSDKVMALPRYLVTDQDTGKTWGKLLAAESR